MGVIEKQKQNRKSQIKFRTNEIFLVFPSLTL